MNRIEAIKIQHQSENSFVICDTGEEIIKWNSHTAVYTLNDEQIEEAYDAYLEEIAADIELTMVQNERRYAGEGV